MTWEEISKKYEQEKRRRPDERRVRLRKDWDDLVRSTDKLVWLFSVSQGARPASRPENN
jgi:hypothetical protein